MPPPILDTAKPATEALLSRVELVVLAQLAPPSNSKPKTRPTSDPDLAAAVRELCRPDASAEQARAEVTEIMAALRRRGLISTQRCHG